MSKSLPGIMTPDKYLQTDEQTLLEIAPHWRLLQVFEVEFGYAANDENRKLGIYDFPPEGITASTVVKPPAYRYGPALRLNVIAVSSNPDAPNLSEWSTCVR